jgi:hypothetical protein
MSWFAAPFVASRALPVRTLLLALVVLVFGCRSGSVFVELDQARTLAAELRVQLNKTNDASNRAVMADTDEASISAAREAQAATRSINQGVAKLETLLSQAAFRDELRTLEVFRTHWAKYQALDEKVLALAVENTNLKAQRLSFGPARQAADEFKDALLNVAASGTAKDHCRTSELATNAILGVREIQVLQAPHIAEIEDAKMADLEKKMADLETSTRKALAELTPLTTATARPALDKAVAAFESFKEASTQILALSRKNTNVRSLDLALREKPALMTGCDESLRALQQGLAGQLSKATR